MKKIYKKIISNSLKKKLLLSGIAVFLGTGNIFAQISLSATSGTTTGSYTTISEAFTAINAGTHKGAIAISVTANTTEPTTVTPLYGSGTASASSSSYTSVSIKPSGGDWTINSATTPSANRGVIELAGADYVTIDGDDPSTTGTRNLTIAAATSTNATASIRVSSNSTSGTDGADNATIKNCNIVGSRSSSTATNINYGIVGCNYSASSLTGGAYKSQNMLLENNNITRTNRGIYLVGSSTSYPNVGLIIRNNVLGSSTASENIGQYGIYCSYTSGSSTSTTTNAIIEGNDIQAGDYSTGFSQSVYGIYLTSYNYGMIIRKNNIHDIAQSTTSGYGAFGIYTGSSLLNDVVIENNFIRDITANSYSAVSTFPSSFQNYGIFISSIGSGAKINHNTIYLNKANATSLTVANPMSACLAFNTTTSLSQLYNNIFINNQGAASSSAMCIYTYGTSNLPTAATNNNNLYAPSSGKIGYYSSALITSLSSWQTTTSLDASSLSESVAFTSATDLHIPAGTISLCESGGVSTATSGVTVDYDNTTRPGTSTYGYGTAPDIGADEFNGKALYSCTTPAPGATVSTPSSICLGQSILLTLTTATTGTGVSYQWQSSPDGIIAYADISGATSSSLVATPTASIYYRCKVTCKNGPVTTISTPVQVAYTYTVLTTTPGIRCGTGKVSLSATGSTGGTLKWYTATSGGLAIGTGSPFTTPSVSTSTNFYVANESSSSGTVVVGSGTSAGNSSTAITPFSLFYTSTHTQYLILSSDLSASGLGSGTISSLSFNVTSKISSIPYSNYTIKLANSSATSLSGLLSPTFSTVYGPTLYNSVSGANTFSLGSTFSWDGSSNVLVDICFDNVTPASGYSSNDEVSFVPKSYTATYGIYSDPTNMCGATTGGSTTSANVIPVMTLGGNIVCSSPRKTVSVTVNTPPAFSIIGSKTVCNNAVDSMSVTSTLSNFDTYTWLPITGLFTNASCTIAYTLGTNASKVYTKYGTASTIKYFCTGNNSTTLCASVDSAIVTTLPSAVTAIATPSSICFSGNTKLTISPASGFGNAGFQWQSSSDNSSFADSTGMTLTTLTTATLSKSRYYRLVLKNSLGNFCLNSTSDTALVYKPNVDSSKGASRCGPGSVTLSASASDGSVNWFAASSGGSSLGTGSSFLTPYLTSSTNFYAEVTASPDVTATIGSGSTTLSGSGTTPFGLFYESARTQYLITASELTAASFTAGSFTSMAFDVSSKLSSAAFNGYTIKLANTTATSLSAYLTPTFTTVYGPSSYSSSLGLNSFSLSGGFSWDGSSNIVVEICFSNAGLGYSSNDAVKATTKSYTGTYGNYSDGIDLCSTTGSSTSSSDVPDITFTRQGCVSGRTAVLATINTIPKPTISPAIGPIQICDGSTTTFTAGGGGKYQWKNASGILIGDTASTFTTGSTGTYRVIVTTPSTGCKDSSVFVGVNVNATPTVSILPSGTRYICADSFQKFTSVVTGAGLSYKWYNSGILIPTASKDTFSTNLAGVYTLRVFLGTCSDTSNEATLIINPLPTASFTKTGTTGAICLGSTLELTALTTPAGYTYQWMLNGVDIPGANTRIYNAPTGGIYTVRIKDVNNCRKISDTMSIINTPMGIPNLSPKDVRFCEGAEITLYSNAGIYAKYYSWTKDGIATSDSNATLTTGKNGVYDVTVEDVFGCVLTSAQVLITVDPLPTKPIIMQTGTTLTTSIPYTSYQWYRNGKAIAGADKRNYMLLFDGYYHVEVMNTMNCFNKSDSFIIKNLSAQPLSRNNVEIKVYPNPTQSTVTIEAPIPVNLSVMDITGKKIMDVKDAKSVDMGLFADGMYIFTLSDINGTILKMDKVNKRTN